MTVFTLSYPSFVRAVSEITDCKSALFRKDFYTVWYKMDSFFIQLMPRRFHSMKFTCVHMVVWLYSISQLYLQISILNDGIGSIWLQNCTAIFLREQPGLSIHRASIMKYLWNEEAFYLKPTFESNTRSNPLCVTELISFAMRLREKNIEISDRKGVVVTWEALEGCAMNYSSDLIWLYPIWGCGPVETLSSCSHNLVL